MNEYSFKSSEILFARIKEDLSSYDSVGLIDEGKFYQYIKYIIDTLGISFYDKKEAVIHIKDYKGELPKDFSLLEAAYKCNPASTSITPQPDALQWQFVGYNEVIEGQSQANACFINCDNDTTPTQVIVRFYVKDIPMINTYAMPVLLKLSNSVPRDRCTSDCRNWFVTTCPYEISIDSCHMYTNFPSDCVYMKYYAFPCDDQGLPMVPDNAIIEDCIEYYIKYRLFEQMHLNGDDVNIERKLGYLKQMWNEKLAEAKHYGKFPQFATIINGIRLNRRRLNIYELNTRPLRRSY